MNLARSVPIKPKRKPKTVRWIVLLVVAVLAYPVGQTLVQQVKMSMFEADLAHLADKLEKSSTPDADTREFARKHDASRDVVPGHKPRQTRVVIGLSYDVFLPFPHSEDVDWEFDFDHGRLIGFDKERFTTYL